MTTGQDITTFVTRLNAGLPVDATLLAVLINTAKTIIEGERPWIALRRTNTSLSLTTANLYTDAVSLAGITDFAEFYGDLPISLFDGDNRIERYRLVSFDRRLEYKDVPNTFCFDEYNNNLYFNGLVPFNGTIYLNYKATTEDIDLDSDSPVWSPFPARFLPLLGFYADGINKGGIDYDSITRQMLSTNKAVFEALHNAMIEWDNQRQLASITLNDPTDMYGGHRDGAVNRN
jgi:hypothetical protein